MKRSPAPKPGNEKLGMQRELFSAHPALNLGLLIWEACAVTCHGSVQGYRHSLGPGWNLLKCIIHAQSKVEFMVNKIPGHRNT